MKLSINRRLFKANAIGLVAGLFVFAFSFTACSKFNSVKKNSKSPIVHEDSSALKNFKGPYSRIIVLSPSLAEDFYAVGGEECLVARTDFCDFPLEIKSLPSVGGFDGTSLSLETILAMEGDFVCGSKGMHDFLVPALKGIPVYLSSPKNINDVMEEILFAGRWTGHEENALKKIEEMKNALAVIKENSSQKNQKKKTVYYEVWPSPYMSVGKNSFINDLISLAGASNIFKDIENEYPLVSEESIISANPSVIILPSANGISLEQVKKRPAWAELDAVKNGNVFLVDADVFSRPGPRLIQAVEKLSQILNKEAENAETDTEIK